MDIPLFLLCLPLSNSEMRTAASLKTWLSSGFGGAKQLFVCAACGSDQLPVNRVSLVDPMTLWSVDPEDPVFRSPQRVGTCGLYLTFPWARADIRMTPRTGWISCLSVPIASLHPSLIRRWELSLASSQGSCKAYCKLTSH